MKRIRVSASRKRNSKKVQCLSSSRTSQSKQKAQTITELRHKYDLDLLLNCINMVRSTYYYYEKKCQSIDKYQEIKQLIKQIFNHHKGRLGYRRITLLIKQKGIIINHKTVLRLMKVLGLKSLIRIKKYKSYKGKQGKIAPNILQRNFKAVKPNEKWATDVTEFNVSGNKLYLSPIIDLFNGEIISYELSEKPHFNQIVNMLKKSFTKISNNTNLILHSDQGWQYQMKQYQYLLKQKGIKQSMSRKGNCLDNAIIENFFGILKSELFYLKKYSSINQLKQEIIEYIDYYNNERIKLNLKGMSPIQYRAHYYQI
ncbi:IS3 family transposase [Flavobacterium sp. DGU99]|uniref:IS3 family transposase n=1 Tax=Flavobacterium flavipallidum TaxID=3139140 RepID=A0ABU9HS41_9FLAO